MTTTTMTVPHNTSLIMWDDKQKVEEIRKLFAPKLSEMEFQFFIGLGKASGLNPFTREIWAVKYGDSPAQVFIGRDGYRKAAQAHSEYDYHQSDAVYENDKFDVVNGEVRHAYTLTNRGSLIGAYCIAKRHKSSRPLYVFAELREYSTGKSLWHSQTGKPATMIKKVAESQCLRACFQDLLGGTYGEEEMPHNEEKQDSKPTRSDELLNKLKSAKGQTLEGEIVDLEEVIDAANPEQLKEIHALVAVKEFAPARFANALKHYGVETLGELNTKQAGDFIAILNKETDK